MQGFNMGRYVPPDQEGLTTGNKLAGKHALGARARHLHTTGALIVRFEMPFAVWCETCKPHPTIIGQGVRFNAEKKKVGNYYSTPIYSFRMKHTVCGGTLEIRTDPQNTAYVVTEGARKRDTGEDKELQPGEIAIKPYAREIDPAEKDPFSKLEGKIEDKIRAKTEAARILEIQERQNRDWEDPYEKSKRLRRTFRQERKGLEKADAKREALKDKMSLGIELLDETEGDRQRASMVEFGERPVDIGAHAARVTRVRPMFEQPMDKLKTGPGEKKPRSSKRPRKDDLVATRKASLRRELAGNTRAVIDPFLVDANHPNAWKPSIKKRTTIAASTPSLRENPSGTELESSATAPTPALVGYPSDSE
ncbi:CWC16 protein [Penicillium cf. griseofulvum]|uniref:CWC16 protein n=1 Tax=Penicillium cf. griseofulvum TaxID=2972120 RepID=A0A9W9M4T1_9EURO|nr:CWC16 protein [Penicillium cf. griseofulvum]KAJ5434952.1 CWC16 protein [Penicillium cf. griseofulvum]KAJ5452785.1 CWC16 protein [Penicillium cf. griseofulvum]